MILSYYWQQKKIWACFGSPKWNSCHFSHTKNQYRVPSIVVLSTHWYWSTSSHHGGIEVPSPYFLKHIPYLLLQLFLVLGPGTWVDPWWRAPASADHPTSWFVCSFFILMDSSSCFSLLHIQLSWLPAGWLKGLHKTKAIISLYRFFNQKHFPCFCFSNQAPLDMREESVHLWNKHLLNKNIKLYS